MSNYEQSAVFVDPMDAIVDPEPETELEPIYGRVVDCSRLNIRKKPTVNAEVLTTVKKDSELILDLIKSNEKWFKVCTTSGVEGYCMKQYVTVED